MASNNYLDQLFSYGAAALQASDLTLAQKTFQQILREFPGHPDALNLLGVVFSKKGDDERAVDHITKAIAEQPGNANYYVNRGLVFSKMGELPKAVADLQRSVELNPGFAEGYFNLGIVIKKTGDIVAAKSHFEKAVGLQPKHFNAVFNLGNCELESGNYRTAIGLFEKTIQLNPDFAQAYNNLGIALQEWDRWEEAEKNFRSALQRKPDSSEGIVNLAQLCETQGRIMEAKGVWHYLKNTNQYNPWRAFHAESLCPVIPQSNTQIDSYRQALNQLLDHYIQNPPEGDLAALSKHGVEPPSALIYQGRNDLELKKKFAKLFSPYIPKIEARPASTGPLHIGFVVTSGHEGVFIKCMKGIINNLSREKFRVTVVCNLPNGEKILRPVLNEKTTSFLSVPRDIQVTSSIILSAGFDILHYWESGTDSLNYFLPFLRLAPVQCTSWGWPVTSGIPSMDYFISADGLETPASESQYAEKLLRMSRLPVHYARPPLPHQWKSRSHFSLNEDAHLYLCTQNLRKVHPDFDSMAAAILERDAKGMLVFIEDKQKPITELFRSRIIKNHPGLEQGVRIMKRMPEEEYFSLLKCADVLLDTLYYTGGANTNYDAFAVGTPVVTLPWEEHRGRYTTAAYRQMGIDSCIAKSREKYIDIALSLGNDRSNRSEVARQITENATAVFDDMRALAEFERLLSHMLP